MSRIVWKPLFGVVATYMGVALFKSCQSCFSNISICGDEHNTKQPGATFEVLSIGLL